MTVKRRVFEDCDAEYFVTSDESVFFFRHHAEAYEENQRFHTALHWLINTATKVIKSAETGNPPDSYYMYELRLALEMIKPLLKGESHG